MRLFEHVRFFPWVIVPGAVALVLAAWVGYGPMEAREQRLAADMARVKGELAAAGLGEDPGDLVEWVARLEGEALRLRALAAEARTLDQAPLVLAHGDQPWQLITFEQERAGSSAVALAEAGAAGVKIVEGGFGVLAEARVEGESPRRRWAQLALAKQVIAQAIAARVTEYEALEVQAGLDWRESETGPLWAEEVRLVVRVTGPADRVQAFFEFVVLAGGASRVLWLENVVWRKEGTAAVDHTSATVVVVGLLSPAR